MKVNLIRQLVTWPKFWGPLLSIAATLLYHFGAVYFGYTEGVFLLTVFLVLASLFGLRSGLIAAVGLSAYSYYIASDDMGRVIQVWIGAFLIAVIIGTETRTLRAALAEARWATLEAREHETRARAALERAERNEAAAEALGALNGNILRIRHSRNLLLKILEQQRLDEMAREEIRQVLHTLNNLEQGTAGWQELAKIKGWLGKDD